MWIRQKCSILNIGVIALDNRYDYVSILSHTGSNIFICRQLYYSDVIIIPDAFLFWRSGPNCYIYIVFLVLFFKNIFNYDLCLLVFEFRVCDFGSAPSIGSNVTYHTSGFYVLL